MKKLIEEMKRNHYARKMYKAIRFVVYVVKNPMATINGNEYTCYINKKRLGKKFEDSKYELWLPEIMKNKYGLRFLKCENSDLENYYLVTYYKK
jgi:hypothetical protein